MERVLVVEKQSILKKVDETKKGKYIQEIISGGDYPIVTKIVEQLTEEQALQIELELIASFGTIETGGSLYNTVIPKSIKPKIDNKIIVPSGALEKCPIRSKVT